MADEVELEISVQPGTFIVTKETDVPTLQNLAKDNWQMYQKAVERLRKARRQRDEAKARVMELENELELWKKVAK